MNDESHRYAIGGKPLTCPHCSAAQFVRTTAPGQAEEHASRREAPFHEFFCGQCGWIAVFRAAPDIPVTRVDDDTDLPFSGAETDDLVTPAPCLSCGETIPIGLTRCPSCGWTYRFPDESPF